MIYKNDSQSYRSFPPFPSKNEAPQASAVPTSIAEEDTVDHRDKDQKKGQYGTMKS